MSQETSGKLYPILVILSIAIVIISAAFYSSVVASPKEQKGISVSGSASKFVTPDTALISIGVLTQAATSKEASAENAALMNDVISALKNLGIRDKDMRTSYLTIQPVYSYPKDGSAPNITGYSASNNIQITTIMLDRLSDIVDKSVASGANQIGGISFMVSEEKQKQINNELLADAVKDAESKANKLAESLNARIAGVRTSSISEAGFPQPYVSLMAEKAAATPIQPGESKVTLSVEITYDIE